MALTNLTQVPISELRPTQTRLFKNPLQSNDRPIEVLVIEGLKLVVDGHHRAYKNHVLGKGQVTAVIRTPDYFSDASAYGAPTAEYHFNQAKVCEKEGVTQIAQLTYVACNYF